MTKPKTTPEIRRKRLDWAFRYWLWDIDDWRKVIFADESAFRLFAGYRDVTRQVADPLNPDAIRRDELGSGRKTFMYWGAIAGCQPSNMSRGPGHPPYAAPPPPNAPLGPGHPPYAAPPPPNAPPGPGHPPNAPAPFIYWDTAALGTITGPRFLERILPLLQTFRMQLQFLGHSTSLMQDNAPSHKARIVQDRVAEVFRVIGMPPYSPDMNPIEHIWAYIKNRLRRMHWIETAEQLRAQIDVEWRQIPDNVIRNICESMPKRVEALILGDGYPTKY